jgi:flagellar hook-associated protein 3 FlgL
MRLTDIKGVDRVVKIDLNDNSSFSIDGKSYTIFDANLDENSSTPTPTKADDFTISQLQGIISLAMSSTLPSSNTKSMIDSAISDAKESVEVTLDHNGKLNIKDLTNSGSDIKFSLFDSDINNPSISFMGNHAVVSNDPQFDMFKDLDEIIDALEESIKEPGSDLKHLKNITIEDSIAKIEVLSNHINDKQTQIGSIEKSLDFEEQKASTLELNTQEIKSNIADIDIAQTAIKYQQLSLNYQAMMSTIAKVNSLSLLNYLR